MDYFVSPRPSRRAAETFALLIPLPPVLVAERGHCCGLRAPPPLGLASRLTSLLIPPADVMLPLFAVMRLAWRYYCWALPMWWAAVQAVRCPVPKEVMAAGADDRGVLRRRVKLTASTGATVISSFSEVPVCGILIGHDNHGASTRDAVAAAANTAVDNNTLANAEAVLSIPGLRRPAGPFLASCTMVTELSPLFDTAELTRLWAEYMLTNGVRVGKPRPGCWPFVPRYSPGCFSALPGSKRNPQ